MIQSKKRRQAPPDKVAADHFHWKITECMGKQHPVYKEYCELLQNFRDDLQRRGMEQSGPGSRNRKRAFWETGSANKVVKVAHPQVVPVAQVAGTAPPSESPVVGSNEDRLRGLTYKNAWHYLEEVGPTVNDIVEVHPDKEAKRAGQRWFMIVKKAKIIEVMGKPCIESCRWCKTDTLEPCQKFKESTLCRVESVKAYGVREAPIFDTVRSLTSVKPTPTPTQTQVSACNSDSDVPISSGAARPKVTNDQVLAFVQGISGQSQSQRTSARPKPLVQEVCDGDEYCVCPKCSGY